MAKSVSQPKGKQQDNTVAIPVQNATILQELLGVEIGGDADLLLARVSASSSRSVSPYTSADMLSSYVNQGMPEVKDRVLNTIDAERQWRHDRDEEEQKHRHKLDLDERAQQARSQHYSFAIAVIGILASSIGGYIGVPGGICIAIGCTSIGGPSVATIIARILSLKSSIDKP